MTARTPLETPRILEILRAHNAHATFFLIGDRAARHPEIVAAIRAGGHEIGNHYQYTRKGSVLAHSDDEFARTLLDVERTLGLAPIITTAVAPVVARSADAISPDPQAASSANPAPKFFRAPGGIARSAQLRRARELGYTPSLGCAYPHDPAHPPHAYIRWLITKNLAPGTIVILHDGIADASPALRALPEILAAGANWPPLRHPRRTRRLHTEKVARLIAADSTPEAFRRGFPRSSRPPLSAHRSPHLRRHFAHAHPAAR